MLKLHQLIVVGAVLVGLCWLTVGLAQSEDPFASFKQDVVESNCVVARIDEFPPFGDSATGPEGGAKLSDEEAETVYQCLLPAMRDSYSQSELAVATEYQNWARFPILPELSRAHNNRYVNSYANDIAEAYFSRYEKIGKMPPGSVLAKDSFVVSKSGRAAVNALSVMEKMPPGFDPDLDDWRFTLILPDGRIFGGEYGDDFAVRFCKKCHLDVGED